MALADEIMTRYRSEGGGAGGPVEAEVEVDDEGKREKGKALLAAIRRGDPMAVCEAIQAIAAEGY